MELQDSQLQFDGDERIEHKDTNCCLRKRYLVAVLTFLGCILWGLMPTNYMNLHYFHYGRNEEFPLSHEKVNTCGFLFLLGSLAAPLGAVGVRTWGGAVTFGGAIGLTGLLSCFIPTIIYWPYWVIYLSQILMGIFQGISTCTHIEVLRLWSVPTERSRLIGGANSGLFIGIVLKSLLSKILAFYWGWRTICYVTGGASLVWCLIWFILVRNSPEEDSMITTREKNYIKQSNSYTRDERKVNYSCCSVLKSKPVWAYLIGCFTIAWLPNIYSLFLVSFLSGDSHYSYRIAFEYLNMSPYFCYPIGLLAGSILADYLRNNKKLSISGVHKWYIISGQIVAIIPIIMLTLLGNVSIVTHVAYSVAVDLITIISSVTISVLPVDMGGQYATLIVGFGRTVATLSSVVHAMLIWLLSPDFPYSVPFLKIICVSVGWSVINLSAAWIFYKFGSADLQPWAVSPNSG